MGQAKQRAAVLAAKDIINVAELDDPLESLRRFLDRLPDERFAARFMAGIDRAGALALYLENMESPDADVFVVRDGQEVRAVMDFVRHTMVGATRLCEVSLLCERGDHARTLFRYLRALHPRDWLIAAPQAKTSPAMYRFMMRHLDAIMPCAMRSWFETFCRKGDEKNGYYGPIIPVWERTPVVAPGPGPLNTLMTRAPLSPALISAARNVAYAEALQWMGYPSAQAHVLACEVSGDRIDVQESIACMSALWENTPTHERPEATLRMEAASAQLLDVFKAHAEHT